PLIQDYRRDREPLAAVYCAAKHGKKGSRAGQAADESGSIEEYHSAGGVLRPPKRRTLRISLSSLSARRWSRLGMRGRTSSMILSILSRSASPSRPSRSEKSWTASRIT